MNLHSDYVPDSLALKFNDITSTKHICSISVNANNNNYVIASVILYT